MTILHNQLILENNIFLFIYLRFSLKSCQLSSNSPSVIILFNQFFHILRIFHI